MSSRKMNPEARGTYFVCLIVAEVVAFAVFNPNSVFGAGFVGGSAALMAFLISKLIVQERGISFYVQNIEPSHSSNHMAENHKVNNDELESWEKIKGEKRG